MSRQQPVRCPVSRAASIVLAFVIVAGIVQLALRIRELQVEDTADYGLASARQSVRRVQTAGCRGRILDRRGAVLADNCRQLSIVCLPASFERRTWDLTVAEIARAITNAASVVGLPPSLPLVAIRRHVAHSLAMPLVVWSDVGGSALARFAEHERELAGFMLEESEERTYPQGAAAAHLVGYVGRDRGRAVAGDERFNFFTPELRGRSGLEYFYDSFLNGVPGERKVLVDARGFAIRSWTVVEPQAGPDLRLTIDVAIQWAAARELAGLIGACAVIDPRNGDVLALVSSPGFDPNDFVPVLREDLYRRLADDPAKPLLDRAVGGAYAPGSTFKPVTALAGLRAGYPADQPYVCAGAFELGGMKLRCTSRWGHGEMDLRHALMKSCNPFFCNLGVDIGTNALCAAARDFGLGGRTGLDFSVDMAGVVPDADWKRRTYGEKWFQGDLAQMSIGQGMLLVSPLQMALVAGALGTGYRVTPHLKFGTPAARQPLPFSAEHLAVVREGLKMVVTGDGDARGTGWRGAVDVPVSVAGKTGTAEVGRGASRRKNAWFIAYAPADNPSVAVAMVVENGEGGGVTAAPKVAAVLRRAFER